MVEYQVLAMLSERPRRTMRMSSLAEVTNASLSRLSHLVERLERRDLVRREPDPTDGRFTNAILTDEVSTPSPKQHPDTSLMCDHLSSTSCHPSSCAASVAMPTASCRASTPLASTRTLSLPSMAGSGGRLLRVFRLLERSPSILGWEAPGATAR